MTGILWDGKPLKTLEIVSSPEGGMFYLKGVVAKNGEKLETAYVKELV